MRSWVEAKTLKNPTCTGVRLASVERQIMQGSLMLQRPFAKYERATLTYVRLEYNDLDRFRLACRLKPIRGES